MSQFGKITVGAVEWEYACIGLVSGDYALHPSKSHVHFIHGRADRRHVHGKGPGADASRWLEGLTEMQWEDDAGRGWSLSIDESIGDPPDKTKRWITFVRDDAPAIGTAVETNAPLTGMSDYELQHLHDEAKVEA